MTASGKLALPWMAAVLTVAIWAETFVSTKLLLDNGLVPPDIFFFRFVLAYLFIWIFSHERFFAENAADEFRMFLLGLSGGSLYFLAENTALKFSTASNVAILVGSAPLITAIIVGLRYREERMNWRQWVGSLISFAGMGLVVLNGKVNLHINPLGDALAVGAAVLWGFYSLILRKISGKYSVIFITRKVFAYGLLSMVPFLMFIRPLSLDASILSKPVVWGNLVYLGIVASMLCFLMWNWALSKLGTVRTTNLIYGQCFFTMLIASMVLGERITPMAVLGTVVLIAGMVMNDHYASRRSGS